MIIIPNRTMFLDGKRVERAKSVEVSKDEGELAIRHGWAVEGDAKEAKKAAKAAAEAESAAKADE